jgi:D-xylose transport system substrate-binding protein
MGRGALLAGLTAAVLLAATCAGCSGVVAGGGVKIGAIFSETMVSRWKFDQQGFVDEAKRLGDTPIVLSSQSDAQTQRSQVENMLSQQVGALAIAPVDIKTASSLFALAKSAHVPTIDYNFLVPGNAADYVITRDAEEFGVVAAKQALQQHPTGNFVLVAGDPGNSVATDTMRGYLQVLQPQVDVGKVKIVSQQYNTNWDPQSAEQQVEEALVKANNNVAAVLSGNDGMAIGAIQALKAQNLIGKVFMSGVDADLPNVQAIAQGNQSVTVWADFTQMGKYAADAADAAARGKKFTVPTAKTNAVGGSTVTTIDMPTIVVDKSNLCDWLAKYHYYSVQQVFGSNNSANRCS